MIVRHKRISPILARPFLVAMIFLVLLAQQGCSSSIEVVATQASKSDTTSSKTEFLLWWGLSDKSEFVDCKGTGLQHVTAKTNFFYVLCGVITLGAVIPLEVEYTCTSTDMKEGGPIGSTKGKKQ